MEAFSDITVTMQGVLSGLYALVAVMIIVVLYHLLFIVTDLRKMMRRMEETTAQIESTILKPLAVIDQAFQWVMDHMHHSKKSKAKKEAKETGFHVEGV